MRKRRPEGVESMWAMARWHNGRLRVRRGLPPGALVWLCRIGLHFMTRDLLGDRYACRCRKQQLWNEHLWHGPQAERRAPVNDWANLYRQTPEVPVRATYIGNSPPPGGQQVGDRWDDLLGGFHQWDGSEWRPVEFRVSPPVGGEPNAGGNVLFQDCWFTADDPPRAYSLGDTVRYSAGDVLDRIDNTIAGDICPCGAVPREGSAYCSYDCEPNIAGRDTDTREFGELATPMRWRPDLVTEAPDDGLTSCGGRVPVGRFWREVFERDGTDAVHLRLDDGHRFVGADVSAEFGHDAHNEVWERLERELTDPRHTVPEAPDPASLNVAEWFRMYRYALATPVVAPNARDFLRVTGV